MSAEISQPVPNPPSFFRGFIQGKTRIVLAWVFSFVLIFSARETPAWEGLLICFVGAALRFWASGFLRKDSTVSVGGPYAYTRNPLYLGTYCMALGVAIAVDNWWLVGGLSVLYLGLYHFIILDEETKMKAKFPGVYEKYMGTVPRFLPRMTPPRRSAIEALNADPEATRFSWQVAMKNKAYEAFAAALAMTGGLYLVAWLWSLLPPS